jgi:uncharacterized protein with von Willebrand factor type A (vWA) domain
MTLEKIKEEMLGWKDFYGGDISDTDEIRKAESKEELNRILEKHRELLEDMQRDADSHLDNFKRKLGL